MVLARLLTPQDYGLVAMVTAIVGFVALFKDMGLSMATIQNKDITHEQVSVLFWVNVGISILLGVVLCALAPVITRFYREPRLVGITLVLACTFLFSGLTVQHHALLRRQMRFVTLGGIEVASMAVGVAGRHLMAYLGNRVLGSCSAARHTAVGTMILVWCFCAGDGVPDAASGTPPVAIRRQLTGSVLTTTFHGILTIFCSGDTGY
jgi:PST family polysaccharide transporter